MTPAATIVDVRGVSKRFRRAPGSRASTLHGIGSNGDRSGRDGKGKGGVVALDDVSFEVRRGECFGMIGRNGSGKSTMLRIIAGLSRPSSGAVERDGRVGGILSLGAGLDPDLTGAENAVTSAVLAGVPRRDAPVLVEEMAEWAELQSAIDEPVRTYSDGMRLRLAFSAAVHAPTDIFVLDEALAAGDIRFQEKCLRKLEELRKAGSTVILVSHSMAHVDRLCDRAIWLESGRSLLLGEAKQVTAQYANRDLPAVQPADLIAKHSARLGNGEEVEVVAVRCAPSVAAGGSTSISFDYVAKQALRDVNAMVGLHADGELTRVVDIHSPIGDLAAGRGRITAELGRVDLSAGDYWFDLGLFSTDYGTCYDARWQAAKIVVEGASAPGPYLPPVRWNMARLVPKRSSAAPPA